ncbi:MAG: hypothetical protein M1836_001455 [Candelina mexicana]|nr:MAG: hypothetical protein M1836_001455 [Candelina mexicana]
MRPLVMPASSPHCPLQSVPQGSMPVDPIQRFYHDSNGPWNQHMISGLTAEPYQRPPDPNALTRMDRPNLSFKEHRSRARSEIDSNVTGHILTDPDSGYASKSLATGSVLSADPAEYNQDCTSITGHVNGLQLFHGEGEGTPHYLPSNDIHYQRQDNGFEEPDPAATDLHQCPYCLATLKCHSERKYTHHLLAPLRRKHILRHERPFVCDESGCTRKEGFSTSNDLDRHKKSVHKITPKRGSQKSYRCFSAGCKTKDKLWPRLDNFRQHLQRMHHSEDMNELLRISEQRCDTQPKLDSQQLQSDGSAFGDPALVRLAPRGENPDLIFSANPKDYSVTKSPFLQRPIGSGGDRGPAASADVLPAVASDSKSTLQGSFTPGPLLTSSRTQDPHQLLSDSSQEYERRRNTYPSNFTPRSNETFGPLSSAQPLQPTDLEISPHSTSHVAGLLDKPEKDDFLANQTDESIENFTTALAAKVAESLKIGSSDQELAKAFEAVKNLQSIGSDQRRRNTSHLPSDLDFRQVSTSDRAWDDLESRPLSDRKESCEDASKTLEAQVQKILQAGLSNLMNQQGSNTARTRISPSRMNRSPSRAHIKKHMKRHEKAYGCTFPACNKKFGSKNDWKRHENSQHFQLETWRCSERAVQPPNNPISATPSQIPHESRLVNECARLFFRREVFVSHLKTAHNVSDEAYIRDEAQKRRIGRNGQSQFWCGFCRVIVCLERKGLEAWDEKFDHIGDHFNKGLRIDKWVPVGGDRPKGDESERVGNEGRSGGWEDCEKGAEMPPQQHHQSGPSGFALGKHIASQNALDAEGQPSRKRHKSEVTADDAPAVATAAIVGTEVLTFCVRFFLSGISLLLSAATIIYLKGGVRVWMGLGLVCRCWRLTSDGGACSVDAATVPIPRYQ